MYKPVSLKSILILPLLLFIARFKPLLHCLGRAKESVQVRGALKHFVKVKKKKITVRGFSPTPNPQAGGPHLVGCPRLLIQWIRIYTEDFLPSAT
jgi:hypothetical protein